MLSCPCMIYLNIAKIIKNDVSLWNYYRGEPTNPLCSNSESFKYKNNITGNTYNVDLTIIGGGGNPIPNPNETEVVIPLKHLYNFWRSLNLVLINSEVELISTCSKKCVLADMTVNAAANPAIAAPNGFEFKITDTKLYVLVVSLSKENDIKLLEQLKSGFKITIKWNKYRSKMTTQPQNDNLNYLIDPTFTNVNRLFVLSFSRNNSTDNRDYFSDYYVPNVEIKDFNVLIDGRSFFHLPVEHEEEAYEKIIEMSNNNDNTTGNLSDFVYFKENYKLIAIDLSE